MDSLSIGVDIVDIDRVSKYIKSVDDRFINRVFTKDEIKYCKSKENTAVHFAGKLAGKEAVSKALKISWDKGINWKNIEILNEENGSPKVLLYGYLKEIADKRKIKNIQISISHEKQYAVAFVLVIGRKEDE